jgi:outer membrane lipoprotein carrier protein
MKIKIVICLFFFFGLIHLNATLDNNSLFSTGLFAAESDLPLDEIMTRVENRYAGPGFSAQFDQLSTIKAMAITDTATGKIYVKHPGKMRWAYEEPDRQIIITDGKRLWIYKPDDNQVMIGQYPAFFGDGKGASFLSDMKVVQQKFKIIKEGIDEGGNYRLKLIPREKTFAISKICLLVSERTFDITQIITYNADGDETRIQLSDIRHTENLNDALFSFAAPEGIDIFQLNE